MTAADHVTTAEQKEAVLEWVRSRANPLDGPEEREQKAIAGRAALDALQAQAEAALLGLAEANREHERAEAAEAEVAQLTRLVTEHQNALAQERSKPGGSFDQWDRLQRLANALREIGQMDTTPPAAARIARAALAQTEPTP